MIAGGVATPIWSPVHDREHCWSSSSNFWTSIRRRWALHSCYCTDCWSTGRCHDHMWWTPYRCFDSTHRSQSYPSTRTPAACSCMPHWVQRTSCTRRSTRYHWYVLAGQISACSGRSVSADWVGRCRASSCLCCRWIRLYIPPTNGWRRRIRWCSAGSAAECSRLQNNIHI